MQMVRVQIEDWSSVVHVFKRVKSDLSKHKNDQWKWIYPNRSNYKADIKNGTMYGVKEGDELLAVVTLDDVQSKQYESMRWNDQAGKPCCIHRLAVNPIHQGKGIGKRLLQFIEQLAIEQGYTSVRIDVYAINETAKALYERNGYAAVGEVRYPMRKHSYVTMEKSLLAN